MICPILYLTDENVLDIVDQVKVMIKNGSGVGIDTTGASSDAIKLFNTLRENNS